MTDIRALSVSTVATLGVCCLFFHIKQTETETVQTSQLFLTFESKRVVDMKLVK